MRGSRDFESVATWQAFIDETLRKANANRGRRVAEDLAAMRELDVAKLPEYVEEDLQVSEWSTVPVKHCAYSVPSRLIGEWVRVRIFEDRLEVRFANELQDPALREQHAALDLRLVARLLGRAGKIVVE